MTSTLIDLQMHTCSKCNTSFGKGGGLTVSYCNSCIHQVTTNDSCSDCYSDSSDSESEIEFYEESDKESVKIDRFDPKLIAGYQSFICSQIRKEQEADPHLSCSRYLILASRKWPKSNEYKTICEEIMKENGIRKRCIGKI